jgi:hypothetical protein
MILINAHFQCFGTGAASMDLFSGLKKAYDSFGEEISKTFDSSQSNEDAKAITSPLKEQGDLSATPVGAKAAPSKSLSPEPASTGGDQSSVYATPPTGAGQRRGQGSSNDGGWGQWENQPLMAAKTKNQGVGECKCVLGGGGGDGLMRQLNTRIFGR